MPLRPTPALSLLRVPLLKYEAVDFGMGTVSVVGGKWRVPVTALFYDFDPALADSRGRTNIVDPARTYALDGDISTAGTFVAAPGGPEVDADAGVDMGAADYYMVLVRFGHYTSSSAASSVVRIYASADMTTWTLLTTTSTTSTTEVVKDYSAKLSGYRAFKLRHYSSAAGVTSYCRTYELSVYRVVR